jgi:hypothetical protein
MRSLSAFFVAVVAFFSGCAHSHAQAPKEYKYEYPCSAWREPARVVTNQAVGQADTTLALLSGRIVNYLGTYGSDVLAAKNAASGETFAGTIDTKGQFSLYVPEGRYSAQVMSLDYSPFVVEDLNLRSGQRHQLDVFLHVSLSGSETGTCIYTSKRKLSAKQLNALLARAEARRIRLSQQQTKAEASAQPLK